MEHKRALSTSADCDDQHTKRARVLVTPQMTALKQCLYCASTLHSWMDCTAQCTHCSGFHPGKRCPSLSVQHYTPGGFCIIETSKVSEPRPPVAVPKSGQESTVAWSSPQSINASIPVPPIKNEPAANVSAERAEMIASTPHYEQPPKHTVVTAVPGLGPQRSGSNAMPLYTTKPLGTSSQGPRALAQARERKVWDLLEQQISKAVEDTTWPGKRYNDSSFRTDAKRRMNQAMQILRPMILGTEVEKKTDRVQPMDDATRALVGGGPGMNKRKR